MKKINKKGLIITIIVLLLIALAVASYFLFIKKDDASQNKVDNKQEVEPKEEPKKLQIIDEDSNSRPYAVMINNIKEARVVQSGLPKAYMVYEILAEGGITRYLALFKDVSVDKIGSVRSARHYYLDYVLENDAIYVHWGWSPQAQSDISTLGINNINGLRYEGTYFYRENPFGISSEHTGFTNTELLDKAITNLKYRSTTDKGTLLNYSVDPVMLPDAIDANEVDLTYSNYTKVKYEYDEETKTYNRFNGTTAQIDYPTNTQIAVKNIIAYQLNIYPIANDPKGRQNLDNIGSGEGYYITEGKAVKIKWEKSSRGEKTKYYLEDGTSLKVNDGNTFIQLVPTSGKIEVK